MGAHNYSRKLIAIGKAIPGTDIAPLCEVLVKRIKRVRNTTQAGAYLLADSEGFVYILRQQSPIAERSLKQLHRMIVGLYAAGFPMFPYPIAAQICADLIQHFVDVGFINRPMIHGLSSTIANPANSCITAVQTRSNHE